MTFMTVQFIAFLICVLLIFYLSPVKMRWIVLLIGSIGFYYISCKEALILLLITVGFSYIMGRIVYKNKALLVISLILIFIPLFIVKIYIYRNNVNVIIPLGISFYSLQIAAYLIDVYVGKCEACKNFFRYMLFVTYFPQIIQGPIPRFNKLNEQLKQEYRLNERTFIKGFQLIIWGWFLKLMIADKAGIIVDTVFNNSMEYQGCYVIISGVLYSIQLYTDFLACVCISKGVSELFGIELDENFNSPYFSQSVSEFWRRWHISLSSWLRDYIYIPLGGSRKGLIRKYINLIITFIVSGIWHGLGYKYILWGLINAVYQVIGSIYSPLREKIYNLFHLKKEDKFLIVWRTSVTFVCTMFAWIIFRSSSAREGIVMIKSALTIYNPWIICDGSLLDLGLSWKEWMILLTSVMFLIGVERKQRICSIRDKILEQNIVSRWIIYLAAIVIIMIYGTYGFGFAAQDFIYGGF